MTTDNEDPQDAIRRFKREEHPPVAMSAEVMGFPPHSNTSIEKEKNMIDEKNVQKRGRRGIVT